MPNLPNNTHRHKWEEPTSYSGKRQPKDSPYNNTKWKSYSKRYRGYRLRCAACDLPYRADQLVTDHIIPVRVGGAFWDNRNHQCMCQSCHNSKSAREQAGQIQASIKNKKGELIPDPDVVHEVGAYKSL